MPLNANNATQKNTRIECQQTSTIGIFPAAQQWTIHPRNGILVHLPWRTLFFQIIKQGLFKVPFLRQSSLKICYFQRSFPVYLFTPYLRYLFSFRFYYSEHDSFGGITGTCKYVSSLKCNVTSPSKISGGLSCGCSW